MCVHVDMVRIVAQNSEVMMMVVLVIAVQYWMEHTHYYAVILGNIGFGSRVCIIVKSPFTYRF